MSGFKPQVPDVERLFGDILPRILQDWHVLEQYLPYIGIAVAIYVLSYAWRPCTRAVWGDDELNYDISDTIYWWCCRCCGAACCSSWTRWLGQALGLTQHMIYVDNIIVGDLPISMMGRSVYVVVRQGRHRHAVQSEEQEVYDTDVVQFFSRLPAQVRDGVLDSAVEIAVCRYNKFLGSRDICSVAVPTQAFVSWKKEQSLPAKLALHLKPEFADSTRQPYVYMYVGSSAYRQLPELTEEIVTSRSGCWQSGELTKYANYKIQRIQKMPVVGGSIGRYDQKSDHKASVHRRVRCLTLLMKWNRSILFACMLPALVHVYNTLCHERYEFLAIRKGFETAKDKDLKDMQDIDILERCDRYGDPTLELLWENVPHTQPKNVSEKVNELCRPDKNQTKDTCQHRDTPLQWVLFIIPCKTCNGQNHFLASPWNWAAAILLSVYTCGFRKYKRDLILEEWELPRGQDDVDDWDDFEYSR